MSITPEFANLFTFYMKRAKLTDTALARETGIVRQTIFRWKQAGSAFTPRRSALLQCAQVLQLSESECNELLVAADLDSLKEGEYQSIKKEEEDAANVFTLSHDFLSPFIVGMPVPIPRFVGRRYELDVIAEIWSQQPIQNICVTGPRTVGKTSLLQYLHHIKQTTNYIKRNDRIFQTIPTVLVDFQDIRMQVQSNVLAYILKEFALPLPEEDSKAVDLYWFMDHIEQLTTPAIILLDEIEAGIKAPGLDTSFWNNLRSLSQRFDQKISFVVASGYSPQELMEISIQEDKSSPFFNTFGHIIYLEPWGEKDISSCISLSPKPFTKDEQRWIIEHSKGWPMLVQLLCDLRFKAWRHEQQHSWKEIALKQLTRYSNLLEMETNK